MFLLIFFVFSLFVKIVNFCYPQKLSDMIQEIKNVETLI